MKWILIILIISSCGVLKKNKTKDTSIIKTERAERIDNLFFNIDTTKWASIERVEITYSQDTITGANIITKVTRTRKEAGQSGAVEYKKQDETVKGEKKEKTKAVVVNVDRDTSLKANIPWYAWALAAAVIFGLAYYLISRITL
jgi:hypothetical protein